MGGNIINRVDPVTEFLQRVQNDTSSEDGEKKNASDSYIISDIVAAAEMFSPRTAAELTDMVMGHLEDTDSNGDLPGGMPSQSRVKSLVQQQWDRLKKKYSLSNSNFKDGEKKNATKLKVGDQVVYTKPGSAKSGMDGDVKKIKLESYKGAGDEMITAQMSDGSTVTMFSDYFKKV